MTDFPITAVQAVMARAALGWTVQEAGRHAGVGANTVSRFETGTDAREATKRALRAAYEAVGIIFIAENGEGPGVRLRKGTGIAPHRRLPRRCQRD
jgi:transcriptional regulator with XRE-family HTH domain